MKRRWLAVWMMFTVGALSMSAHNFHASLTSMDYRSDVKNLEMIVVLNADDLEKVLRLQTGREIEIDRTKDAEALVKAYVTRNFELRAPDQKPLPLHWVGMEVKTNFVYVYVETKVENGPKGVKIRDDLFRDLQSDQVNMLTMKQDGQGKSADFTFGPGVTWQTL